MTRTLQLKRASARPASLPPANRVLPYPGTGEAGLYSGRPPGSVTGGTRRHSEAHTHLLRDLEPAQPPVGLEVHLLCEIGGILLIAMFMVGWLTLVFL